MIICIYWTKEGLKIRDKICQFFNIPKRMTVNGETHCEIEDAMIGKLEATERKGYINIRRRGLIQDR